MRWYGCRVMRQFIYGREWQLRDGRGRVGVSDLVWYTVDMVCSRYEGRRARV
jgi:hypothetical protein